ncbi:hypothetical protein J437_LFUL001244 [Ladona fulva]|uniref:DUF7775 domain-containing protein n=1 Tax=Ladona fulva TaxID=123851 RepID=A0A8K0JVE2_LADFU|nr:hypothetical protein J437_LFUL001244 [Ladona fulva]
MLEKTRREKPKMPPYEPISKFSLTLKLIELILSSSCMALNVVASTNTKGVFILTCIVFGGYIIIFSGMVMGILSRERMPRIVDMFFSLVGMALFVAAGSANLSYFIAYVKSQPNLKHLGLTGGSLAIVNAFILLIDAAVTYRTVHDYIPH